MTNPLRVKSPATITRGDLMIYCGPPLESVPPGWSQREDGVVYRRATAEDEHDPNLRVRPSDTDD